MTEIYYFIAWWILGFVGLLWMTSKDYDVDVKDMLILALIAVGGPIPVVIIAIMEHSDMVVIRKRKK